jgi:heptaprenyl diphosphate synthase
VPAVNARWDNTVAILAGDFLFSKASEISADLGTDVTRLLARTIATVCDGQLREVQGSGTVQSTDAYMEVIRRKTAALLATSCRLGGMLSDAAPEAIELLDDLGMALGLAFQLSDDIMDVISTEEELRKEPGQDLREGVYTLPVLHALGGPNGEELQGLLRQSAPSGPAMDRVLAIVRDEGTLAPARLAVTLQVRLAKRIASKLAPGRAREALVNTIEFLAVRCGAEA